MFILVGLTCRGGISDLFGWDMRMMFTQMHKLSVEFM